MDVQWPTVEAERDPLRHQAHDLLDQLNTLRVLRSIRPVTDAVRVLYEIGGE